MKNRKPDPARPKAPAKRSWMWYAAPLASLAVLFWVYGPTMHTPFLFDDVGQQFALSFASAPLAKWIGPVRPVLMFSYWVNTRISLDRSEEHTSELQSLRHLVCRLLL